jgi:hypothetical protein
MSSLSTTPSTIIAVTSPGVAVSSIVSTLMGGSPTTGFALPAGVSGSPGGAQSGTCPSSADRAAQAPIGGFPIVTATKFSCSTSQISLPQFWRKRNDVPNIFGASK